MIDIYVDNRESKKFYELGRSMYPEYNLHYVTLPCFDILIGKDAQIGIEIKRTTDLINSITDESKRFENQSTRMAKFREEHGTHVYFIIGGRYEDIKDDPYYSWVTPKLWSGIFASICEPKDMKILPIYTDEMIWTQIERLIYKYDNKQPLKHVPIIPNGETVTTRMLQGITGLGEVRARAIAEKYPTPYDVVANIHDSEGFLAIEGIGPKHYENIVRAILEGIG